MWINTSKNSRRRETDLVIELAGEGSLLIQLKGDTRRIGKITDDFDETTWIRLEDGREYTEYTEARVACRLDADTVQLRLFREGV